MKRRLLSVLLALSMLMGLLPMLGTAAFAEPEGPQFSGHSLALENDIAIRYYIDKAAFDGAGYTAPQVNFTFKGASATATEFETLSDSYRFTFRGVRSQDMTEPVTATLTALSGGDRVEGSTITTTVADTCSATLDEHADDATLCTLIADLLTYGAKAQAYFGSENDPATSVLTPEELAKATATDPELTNVASTTYEVTPNADVTWYGANLSLKDSVMLQFYFDAETTDSLTVVLTDENGALLASYTDDDFIPWENRYKVRYTGFSANELRKTVFARAFYGVSPDLLGEKELPLAFFGEGVGSNTLSYSVASYVLGAEVQHGGDAALQDLTKAMMRYGVSAEKYAYELKYPTEKTRARAEAYFADPAFDEEVYYVGPTREHTSLISLLLDLDGDAYDAANNNQNKKTIYIDEGEYDFFAEYMAEVYDAENSPHGRILQPVEPATAEEKTTKNIASSQYLEAAVASQNCLPVDRNSTNADGQKFWLNAFVPNNTKIIGLGDVVVRFEPAADEITYNASKTWSPFNIFGNVMIENIDVYGHNCRYCLHNDDHNRYLNTYQYYKDFNLTYTVSDLSTCGVNVGSGIYYGFNHTVGFGVNDGSTHVFDECTITNNTTLTNCAYYGHNASGTNPREAEILLTKCNISTSNANARTIRLQTLSRDNAGHVITTIDRCTVVGGLQLHLYYPDSDHPTWITKQSFEVTFVETHNVPVTRNNASSTDSEVSDRDPYTVKYVNCDPA